MRYFIEVAYDGAAFHGSQVQGNIPTVQGALNNALSTLMRRPVETFGASRTDEGVHALSNFYHIDIEETIMPQLKYKLNAILPPSLGVKAIYQPSDPGANARFDAVGRRYRYRIYQQKNPFLFQRGLYYPYKINLGILQQTAAVLQDYTDFEAFSKRNTQSFTFNCSIKEAYWLETEHEVQFVVAANRFLRGMVRGLVGTQLQMARGKGDVAAFRQIIEGKDCTKADFSVAGHGLYLEAVDYPKDYMVQVQ
ncbi:MAG: tRNA pseudouridine synthase A [Edaphocola sp.]